MTHPLRINKLLCHGKSWHTHTACRHREMYCSAFLFLASAYWASSRSDLIEMLNVLFIRKALLVLFGPVMFNSLSVCLFKMSGRFFFLSFSVHLLHSLSSQLCLSGRVGCTSYICVVALFCLPVKELWATSCHNTFVCQQYQMVLFGFDVPTSQLLRETAVRDDYSQRESRTKPTKHS